MAIDGPPRSPTPNLRLRIAKAFYAWGLWVSQRARIVIAACLALIFGLASLLPQLTADFSLEGYLHPDDPTRLFYDEFRHQFDRGDSIMIGIETGDVFELAFLEKLRAFHEELEARSPHAEEIVSLINARWTHGDEDSLFVEDQLEDWPETEAELEVLRARIMANPLFPGRLISRDAGLTSLTIRPDVYSSRGEDFALDGFSESRENGDAEFLTDAEVQELVTAVKEIARDHERPDFRTYIVGPSVISTHLSVKSVQDTIRTTLLALGFLTALLYLLFRRISGVLLTLIVISASAVTGVACMVPLGVAFSSMSQFLPTLLLAVGACDAIHILTMFYRRLDSGREPHIAIAESLEHSGLAVVMTSLTTAAGLLCFLGAGLLPVSELGKIAPLGIGLALFFTLTLLPACLAVWPHRPSTKLRSASILRDLLLSTGEFGMNHSKTVLAGTLLVSVISLIGAP